MSHRGTTGSTRGYMSPGNTHIGPGRHRVTPESTRSRQAIAGHTGRARQCQVARHTRSHQASPDHISDTPDRQCQVAAAHTQGRNPSRTRSHSAHQLAQGRDRSHRGQTTTSRRVTPGHTRVTTRSREVTTCHQDAQAHKTRTQQDTREVTSPRVAPGHSRSQQVTPVPSQVTIIV
jgi:hypothetical protein